MYEFITGTITASSPAHVVLSNNGIGYFINISINTYSYIKDLETATLYIHQAIREDAHTLYGFHDTGERDLFRHLISVSGIGTNTARVMLSSMSAEELRTAILTGNVEILKSVKGIGLKTAQRVIIDLKDKIGKSNINENLFAQTNNTARDEALSALMMLGFSKPAILKAMEKIMPGQSNPKVENIIKEALKIL